MTQHDENLIELVGPTNEGWYRTQIPDWIALHPDLKDGAFRLYVILRSLILEKQKTKIRVLSYDQLAFLMVGKNGKPVSESTIKSLLRNLHDLGLVDNPDGARLVTSTGHGGISSRRRYRLNDWPKDRNAYTGWRNTFDKLAAFTEDWRTSRTDVCPGNLEGQKVDRRVDQGEHSVPSTPTRVSPAQLVRQNSDRDGQISDHDGQISDARTPVTSENATSLKEFPKEVSSSSAPAEAAAPPRPRRSEEEEENNTKGQKNTSSGQRRCTTCTRPDQRKCTTCTKSAETPETRAIRVVLDRLADHSPTEDEAQAVITHIRTQATQRGTTIARIDKWIDGRDPDTLRHDLDHIRAQTKARRRPSEGTCRIHGDKRLPCIYCRMSAHAGDWTDLITELQRAGAEGRPDLDALVREYGVEHLLAA